MSRVSDGLDLFVHVLNVTNGHLSEAIGLPQLPLAKAAAVIPVAVQFGRATYVDASWRCMIWIMFPVVGRP